MKRSLTRFIISNVFGAHAPHIYLHFGGTSVLMLYEKNIPGFSKFKIMRYRWFIKRLTNLTNLKILIDTERLRPFLIDFGFDPEIISLKEYPWERILVEKKEHIGFNILFYLPYHRHESEKHIDWMYGKEYLDKMYELLDDNIFIVYGGADMFNNVYPIIDCYVKINRSPHNDRNRISKECAYNNIPEKAFDVWRSDFKIGDIIDWINSLKKSGNSLQQKK